MRILGEVVVRSNGNQLKTKKGSTLMPGGYTYTDHIGPGKSWGASREFTAPTMQVTIAAAEDVDVLDINAMEAATLTWEGDNGIDYMMTGCSPQAPFQLTDSGEITGTFRGEKVEKTS